MLRVGCKALIPARPVGRALRAFSSTNGNEKSESNNGDVKPGATAAEGQEGAKATAEDDPIAKLTQENKDLKDKLIRSYAEEENVRRIAKRDVENARQYANASFAKSLLDVADNLERAMEAVPAESHASTDPIIKNLLIGVKMTNTDLVKVFDKFGVKKYGAVGDKFDPNIHDALFQIPDASKDANTIGQVLKPGYKMHDRVIRAAEVGTFVTPPSESSQNE